MAESRPNPLRLSIIVPTLNEAAAIVPALEHLRGRLAKLEDEAEVIVADGGSSDGTPEMAAALARVVEAPRGRAKQLNAGARAAAPEEGGTRGAEHDPGDWLLFLHADTRLPSGFIEDIRRARDRGFSAGAFRLRIVGSHPLLPLLAWGANLRTQLRSVALGDQALFCTRALFEQQRGFPDLPILEDYVFTLTLRRAGIPLFLARRAVETSGRRWDERGFWRTWWQFRTIYRRFHREHDLKSLGEGYEEVR